MRWSTTATTATRALRLCLPGDLWSHSKGMCKRAPRWIAVSPRNSPASACLVNNLDPPQAIPWPFGDGSIARCPILHPASRSYAHLGASSDPPPPHLVPAPTPLTITSGLRLDDKKSAIYNVGWTLASVSLEREKTPSRSLTPLVPPDFVLRPVDPCHRSRVRSPSPTNGRGWWQPRGRGRARPRYFLLSFRREGDCKRSSKACL